MQFSNTVLEIIATCVQDAIEAEKNGADRIELITAFTEGGLTPGIGMVQCVVAAVSIPVHVMVRPHSRSFVYDRLDKDTMAQEIQAIAKTGAAGIVIGLVTEDRQIDTQGLAELLPLAEGMNVTFHRAFDELGDQLSGIQTLLRYPQINRVLTSGGPKPAPQAIDGIKALVAAAEGSPLRILAGSGLNIEGIADFVAATGVQEVHFGTAVRCGSSALAGIDPVRLRALADILHHDGV
ncbi:copper homeostasis protein CutC [Paenibacillus sp. GCM10012307]|uniref:PF03932 family protein CutC n=1 Tax=Paenibacillus roseus TaxID=2798579 RepID=A0A934J5Y1_9BACL|nr:copper homeostasis protein CutC [Paenibacillus roseus]MBJ6362329.1 copper homeostasis protein CutC [Paenibacillus roseus]